MKHAGACTLTALGNLILLLNGPLVKWCGGAYAQCEVGSCDKRVRRTALVKPPKKAAKSVPVLTTVGEDPRLTDMNRERNRRVVFFSSAHSGSTLCARSHVSAHLETLPELGGERLGLETDGFRPPYDFRRQIAFELDRPQFQAFGCGKH